MEVFPKVRGRKRAGNREGPMEVFPKVRGRKRAGNREDRMEVFPKGVTQSLAKFPDARTSLFSPPAPPSFTYRNARAAVVRAVRAVAAGRAGADSRALAVDRRDLQCAT